MSNTWKRIYSSKCIDRVMTGSSYDQIFRTNWSVISCILDSPVHLMCRSVRYWSGYCCLSARRFWVQTCQPTVLFLWRVYIFTLYLFGASIFLLHSKNMQVVPQVQVFRLAWSREDAWMDAWLKGWVNGWTDDGLMDEQMEGWTDGWIYLVLWYVSASTE